MESSSASASPLLNPNSNCSSFTQPPEIGAFPLSTLQAVNLKLMEENYRYWRAQALPSVGAHDLEEHLIGLVQCP